MFGPCVVVVVAVVVPNPVADLPHRCSCWLLLLLLVPQAAVAAAAVGQFLLASRSLAASGGVVVLIPAFAHRAVLECDVRSLLRRVLDRNSVV